MDADEFMHVSVGAPYQTDIETSIFAAAYAKALSEGAMQQSGTAQEDAVARALEFAFFALSTFRRALKNDPRIFTKLGREP